MVHLTLLYLTKQLNRAQSSGLKQSTRFFESNRVNRASERHAPRRVVISVMRSCVRAYVPDTLRDLGPHRPSRSELTGLESDSLVRG